MKKLSIIMISLCTIILSGCSDDKLVCTYNQNVNSDIVPESKYVFKFNDGKVSKAEMTTKIILNGEYNKDEYINSYIEDANDAAADFNKVAGVTAKVKNKKNTVSITVKMNTSEMSETSKEEYGLNYSKERLNKNFEDLGYTCK